MADNFPYTPGAGRTGASKDVDDIDYPRMVPTYGGAGEAIDVDDATPFPVVDIPDARGSWEPHLRLVEASVDKILVKTGATLLGGWAPFNKNAAPRYVKCYDAAATGDVTVGTTVPKWIIPIPGNADGVLANAEFAKGIKFTLGLVYAVVTGFANSDTTAPGANEVMLNLAYK